MNLGTKLYMSRKMVPHDSNTRARFQSSNDEAVVNRQYDSGKPALSYSPRMVYSSRCLEFVLSMVSMVSRSISDAQGVSLTGSIHSNFDNLSPKWQGYLFHHPCNMLNTVDIQKIKDGHIAWSSPRSVRTDGICCVPHFQSVSLIIVQAV